MMKIAALTAIALYVGTLMDAAYSQIIFCGAYEKSARHLANKYGEHLFDAEPDGDELWINIDTGSFTVLSHKGNEACILRSGKLNPKRLKKMLESRKDLVT